MKNKKDWFELFSIGTGNTKEKRIVITIDKKYIGGLKYLSLFSHAIIIYLEKQGVSNIINTPLLQKVIRLVKVDEKIGTVEGEIFCNYMIHGKDEIVDLQVFDIKPYFPSEDRVKDCIVPKTVNNKITTIQKKQSVLPSKMQNELDDFVSRQSKNFMQIKATEADLVLTSIGYIQKIRGDYFLEFHSDTISYLHKMHGYSHIKIFWWFHKFDKSNYRRVVQCDPPYENAPRTGVFATRSPVRPNPIALTTVKILSMDEEQGRVKVSGLDCFDKTPFLGFSMYEPENDQIQEYFLPEWLMHWPEWKYDKEDNIWDGFDVTHDITDNKITSNEISLESMLQLIHPCHKVGQVTDLLKEDEKVQLNNEDGIVIKGARQNNLKNIDVTIPFRKITVITGVSGSGKSSLAFDTIFAESKHRFMESMSMVERAQLKQLEKPQYEQIWGLPPAIAISQRNVNRNPRSTVGTMTDIYDFLRSLYAIIGIRHCPECGAAIVPLKEEEIVTLLENYILSKGFKDYSNKSFVIKPYGREEILFSYNEETKKYNISNKRELLKEAVTTGLELGKGALHVLFNTSDMIFQTTQMCYHCNHVFFELTPSDFSFNNPEKMCPVCKGLGVTMEVDPDSIISNPKLSLLDGASGFLGNLRKFREEPNANWMKGEILALAEDMGIDLEIPWMQLPEEFKKCALYGTGNREVTFFYANKKNGRNGTITRPVEGLYPVIERLLKGSSGDTTKQISETYMKTKECICCHGERLSGESRGVTIAGTRFPEVVKMSMEELKQWIENLPEKISGYEFDIALPILKEIHNRLNYYMDAGLSYLTLDRSAPSLSGGELQRLRLVSQLNIGITNMLYILDEPSTGLHPKDHNTLLQVIQRLKDLGNTVIVVEHDSNTMLAADYIIDMGPEAGDFGGYIVAQGAPKEIMKNSNSETGKYLSGEKTIGSCDETALNLYDQTVLDSCEDMVLDSCEDTVLNLYDKTVMDACEEKVTDSNSTTVMDLWRSNRDTKNWVEITGVKGNNLKNINIKFPTAALICITGVSGSGKSSLIENGISPAIEALINGYENPHKQYDSIITTKVFDKIVSVSQQPIGKSARSNPATYTGLMDEIRNLFAQTKEAKQKGFKAGRFSFNSKEGQCSVCNGEGRKSLELLFMPDVSTKCPICNGKQYNAETLKIKYKGKSIADILEMSIQTAYEFFKDQVKISFSLKTLIEIGLGYLKLGQSSITLSGGEAQRIKLATELSLSGNGKTLYILDEPTTGLHFKDIQNLYIMLRKMTKEGNTVILVEHNMDIVSKADWIIDLGPEGGFQGGNVVAQGTPSDVQNSKSSYTGEVLRNIINK